MVSTTRFSKWCLPLGFQFFKIFFFYPTTPFLRKVDEGEKRKEKKEKKKRKKKRKRNIMAFLVATTSLPAVYQPNDNARTTTAGTPHTRANFVILLLPGIFDVH